MNCANHPDVPVAAYCQNCGKPLCTQCVRSVAGVVYCEPCLAARLHGPGSAPGAQAASPAAGATQTSSAWSAVPLQPGYTAMNDPFGRSPSPILAGLLGIIPGVGAMYNGQFIKALVHVLVLIFLIGATDHFPLAGILIAAWVFYQIFDAIQTAVARRDGLPLPDPFGLNDLGNRLGVPGIAAPRRVYATQPAPDRSAAEPLMTEPSGPLPPVGGASTNWEDHAGRDAGTPWNPAPAGWGAVPGPPPPGAPAVAPAPSPYPVVYGGRPEPVGAIVLIIVGILFLLSTLGVFEWHWIGRGWPVIIIVIGAGMLFRRLRSASPVGGGL